MNKFKPITKIEDQCIVGNEVRNEEDSISKQSHVK